MSCPLQSPLDGSKLMVWGIFICCTAQSKKPLTGAAPRSTVPKCSSRFLCNTEAPNTWLMLLQGANPAGKEPALLPTHAQAARGWTEEPWLGQRGQDGVGAVLGHAGSSQLSSPSPAWALTALIFFHCRSSSALSFVSLKRRVLRPSDILMPYWKAALEKEQDMAQHSQGIHSLPEEGTRLPSHEHMLQSWPEPLKAESGLESSRATLRAKTNHQAQDPQLLLRSSQGSTQLALSCPSTQVWPAGPSHPEPSLGHS